MCLPDKHSSSIRTKNTYLYTRSSGQDNCRLTGQVNCCLTQKRNKGDRTWAEKISEFEVNSTTIVEQCRGKVIRFTGDGVKAAFEVPGDGLRAARMLVQDASESGHPIRAGLHTGEVQWTDEDLHGMAVNIASRVADQADAGEVLTTTVTQGIVEGGDYTFTERGEADLKGIGVRKLVRLLQD